MRTEDSFLSSNLKLMLKSTDFSRLVKTGPETFIDAGLNIQTHRSLAMKYLKPSNHQSLALILLAAGTTSTALATANSLSMLRAV